VETLGAAFSRQFGGGAGRREGTGRIWLPDVFG